MDRPEFKDEDEEPEEQEEPQKKRGRFSMPTDLERYMGWATSFLGLTSITILTFELVLGAIRFGTILAYAIATAVMLGMLILLFLGLKWSSEKVPQGMLRWSFWLIASPFALFYYLLVGFLVYDKMAHSFMALMKMAFANVLTL